jgi:O-antigen biosynthesis protein
LNPYGLVIPSRFKDVIDPLLDSIEKFCPKPPETIILGDGYKHPGREWARSVDLKAELGYELFVFSRTVNWGLQYFDPLDVILLNDDCRITEENFFDRLAEMAQKPKRLGILAPLIDGGVGNPYQSASEAPKLWKRFGDTIALEGHAVNSLPICFIAVYLRRSLVAKIGGMDERLTGYGLDDNDYCNRARVGGFETCITRALTIQHGAGGGDLDRGINWSCTWARRNYEEPNTERFHKSWAR